MHNHCLKKKENAREISSLILSSIPILLFKVDELLFILIIFLYNLFYTVILLLFNLDINNLNINTFKLNKKYYIK